MSSHVLAGVAALAGLDMPRSRRLADEEPLANGVRLFARSRAKSTEEVLRLLDDDWERNAAVLIGDPVRYIMFQCPCGSGVPVRLRIGAKVSPTWQLTIQEDTKQVALKPSVVFHHDGAKCHYSWKDSGLEWNDPPPKRE